MGRSMTQESGPRAASRKVGRIVWCLCTDDRRSGKIVIDLGNRGTSIKVIGGGVGRDALSI